MSFIVKQLKSNGHICFIYANNIVIYTNNYYLNAPVEALNNDLKTLNSSLVNSFICISVV